MLDDTPECCFQRGVESFLRLGATLLTVRLRIFGSTSRFVCTKGLLPYLPLLRPSEPLPYRLCTSSHLLVCILLHRNLPKYHISTWPRRARARSQRQHLCLYWGRLQGWICARPLQVQLRIHLSSRLSHPAIDVFFWILANRCKNNSKEGIFIWRTTCVQVIRGMCQFLKLWLLLKS